MKLWLAEPMKYPEIQALWYIEKIGPAAAPLVPILIEKLDSFDDGVRSRAARDLEAIGPAAGEAVPRLRATLNDKSLAVQAAAERALKVIDPPCPAFSSSPAPR